MIDIKNKLITFSIIAVITVPSISYAVNPHDAGPNAAEVYRVASQSVVQVYAHLPSLPDEQRGTLYGQGAGVVVAKQKIITNCHVLRGALEPVVRSSSGHEETAKLINVDFSRDLCLLKTTGNNEDFISDDRHVVEIASSSSDLGDSVFAIGSPSGLHGTLSTGVISSVRQVEGLEVIQTTTSLSPGSSGGGLFNSDGELLGITSFSVGQAGNLNFAMPADSILGLLKQSKEEADVPGVLNGMRRQVGQVSADSRVAEEGVGPWGDVHLLDSLRAIADDSIWPALDIFNAFSSSSFPGGLEPDAEAAFRWAHEATMREPELLSGWAALSKAAARIPRLERQARDYAKEAFDRRTTARSGWDARRLYDRLCAHSLESKAGQLLREYPELRAGNPAHLVNEQTPCGP